MKIRFGKLFLAGALTLAALTGCGGGGGGSSSSPPAGATKIKGTVSAGIIYPGTVNVYAVDTGGKKGMLLAGPVSTDVNGAYNAPLGSYSGPVMVEASGTYKDEATGHTVTISPSKPLHAMVDNVNETYDNNRVVSVTPLTELAWRKASSSGTLSTPPAAMVSANQLVDDLFKISDIIGIEPVRPDRASMANASHDSQTYTLALATLSQMASMATGTTDNEKLESVLHDMAVEVENAARSGAMSATAINDFITAMGSVSLSDDFPTPTDQLSHMGQESKKLTLSTSGTLPSGTAIYAIQGSISLPAGVSLPADSNGNVISDVFSLAGTAEQLSATDPVMTYLAPQKQANFSILLDPSKTGIGIGDFATINYEMDSGVTVSAADFSFVAGSIVVKDASGAVISGVTLTIR